MVREQENMKQEAPHQEENRLVIDSSRLRERFSDYEEAKKGLRITLCDPAINMHMMVPGCVRKSNGVFVELYEVCVEVGDESRAIMHVMEHHLKAWGIDKEQLRADAFARENERGVILADLEEVMFYNMGKGGPQNLLEEPEAYPRGDEARIEIYVLGNKEDYKGACNMLNPKIMEQVAEIMQEGFMVVPSSQHEVLLIPDHRAARMEDLQKMVREVNRDFVDRKDWLSDRIFHYDRERRILEVVSDERIRGEDGRNLNKGNKKRDDYER